MMQSTVEVAESAGFLLIIFNLSSFVLCVNAIVVAKPDKTLMTS